MPETALTLTYDELQKQVADYMFGTRNLKRVNADDTERLQSVVFNGLRKFYYPQQLGVQFTHDWSFLVTDFDFKTEASTPDYVMPFDFGGTVGPMHHDGADNVRTSLTKVTVNKILFQRQTLLSITNWPTMYAESPVNQGGRASTRWKLMLWPTPSAVYRLHGRMRIQPLAPNGAQMYLYGGPEHSQTIIESCLAEAELKYENQPGAHAAAFQSCLLTSIALDHSMHGPELLGYNGDGDDRRDSSLLRPDGRGFENFAAVTVGGTDYSG